MTHPLTLAATAGSALYLYDQTYRMKWGNMSYEYKTDWLMLFDMMRDDTNYSLMTERVIEAITQGFCPYKIRVLVEITVAKWNRHEYGGGRYGLYGTDWTTKDMWVFVVGKDVSLPNILPIKECYSHFVMVENANMWELKRRKNSLSMKRKKVKCFDHPVEAWKFLFEFMLNQVKTW